MSEAKILVLDIETSPLTVYSWGLNDQTLGTHQLKTDWSILAWCAKWLGSSKPIYADCRRQKDIHDDKALLIRLIKLMNKADIIVTQNGEKFDFKKINARALMNGLPPIKPYKSTDIYKEGKKMFSFTSHSLDYISDKLNKKYKKLKHARYPGFSLWKAIEEGDKGAWPEMERYCINDVLATEEAYLNIQGWIKTQNLSSYSDSVAQRCHCGSSNLKPRGFAHTDSGKYQIYRCSDCGKWPRSKANLLNADKKKGLLK